MAHTNLRTRIKLIAERQYGSKIDSTAMVDEIMELVMIFTKYKEVKEESPCDHPKNILHQYHDLSVICEKCHEVIWQVDFSKPNTLAQFRGVDNPMFAK